MLAALLPPGSTDAWAAAGDGGGGFTANVPGGTYTTLGAGKRPARLDYLFAVGNGATPVRASVAMHVDPASGRSFSDHAGVEAAFAIGSGSGGGEGLAASHGWEAVEAPPRVGGDAASSTPSPSKRAWLGSLSGGRRTPGGSGGGGSGGRRRREAAGTAVAGGHHGAAQGGGGAPITATTPAAAAGTARWTAAGERRRAAAAAAGRVGGVVKSSAAVAAALAARAAALLSKYAAEEIQQQLSGPIYVGYG